LLFSYLTVYFRL